MMFRPSRPRVAAKVDHNVVESGTAGLLQGADPSGLGRHDEMRGRGGQRSRSTACVGDLSDYLCRSRTVDTRKRADGSVFT